MRYTQQFFDKKTKIKPTASHANGIMYSDASKKENLESNVNLSVSKYLIPFTNAFATKETTAPIVNPTREDTHK